MISYIGDWKWRTPIRMFFSGGKFCRVLPQEGYIRGTRNAIRLDYTFVPFLQFTFNPTSTETGKFPLCFSFK